MPDVNNTQETQENQNTTVQTDVQIGEVSLHDSLSDVTSYLLGKDQTEGKPVEPDKSEDEAKPEEAEPEEKTEETENVFVIDDSFIEKYPSFKTMKGKSVDDIAKSYVNLLQHVSKVNNDNSVLKKELKRLQEVKPEIKEEPFPDLSELTPDEQKAAIAKFVANELAKQSQKQVQEPVNHADEGKQQQEFNNRLYSSVLETVKPYLPEKSEYDFESLMNDWRLDVGLIHADGTLNELVAEEYSQMRESAVFREIKLFAKERELARIEKEKNAKSKKTAAQMVRESVKNSDKPEIKSTASQREQALTDDEAFADQFTKYLQNKQNL